MTVLRSGAATDVGRVRSNNQDHLLVADPLFAVADGMGGHVGGEVASLTAVEELLAGFKEDRTADGLAEAVRRANRAVWDRARRERDLRGMGTTMTAVALVQDGDDEVLAIVNVGDSRAYLFRDNDLDQLTQDHSVPKELERAGRLSPEEAAVHPQHNVLTRALGVEQEVEVDSFEVIPYRGDRVLLASDGLFNEVEDSDIAGILRRVDDPDEAAQELVRMASENGGNDNITVVIVDVVDDDDRAGRASAAVRTSKYEAVASGTPSASRSPSSEEPEGWQPRSAAATGVTTARPAPPPAAPRPEEPASGRRRLTLRVALFVLVLLGILGAAVAAVGFYARGSYYVGLSGEQVVIYKGRPGGLLWFDPTVEERTDLVVDQLRGSQEQALRDGKEEPSLEDARGYVQNIERQVATTTTTVQPLPPEPPPLVPPR